ncbi:HD domain-containing protein, partial [Methylobacterium sp. WL103]
AGADLVVGALNKADIRGWLDVVWRFDDATHQHCLLVAGLAAAFARQLGLRAQDCRDLTQAALLHDLGKARIPLAILNKPGRLDADEMTVMRTHPALGIAMLQGQDYPAAMLAVVRSHHEALDGSGYPDGLTAKQIPDLVRLITVCDIFGALIERRPYKRPHSGEAAYDILRGMTGKVDPDLVNAFKPIAEAAGSAMASASAA